MAGISPDIGEADRPAGDVNGDGGRSPRKGEDRAGRRDHGLHQKSIPAHAGEPIAFEGAGLVGAVYPRACGGGTTTG